MSDTAVKYLWPLLVLFLAACGTDSRPGVSHHGDYVPSGMNYEDFRSHADARAREQGGAEWEQRQDESATGNRALHKRFMAMDRNNDGHLSPAEMGGY